MVLPPLFPHASCSQRAQVGMWWGLSARWWKLRQVTSRYSLTEDWDVPGQVPRALGYIADHGLARQRRAVNHGAKTLTRCTVLDDLPRLVYRCGQILLVVILVSTVGMLALKVLRPGL